MSQLLPKEFIQTYVITQLEQVTKVAPYLSFTLMAVCIEFLGKCLDDSTMDWHKKGTNFEDFNRTIDLTAFSALKGIGTKGFLQNSLRNGMVHSLRPKATSKWTIGLDSGKNKPHEIDLPKKYVILHCEQLYIDIKNAAYEIITMIDNNKFKLTGKMYKPILNVTP